MNLKASGRQSQLPAVVRQNMIGWKAAYRVVNGVRTIQLSGSYKRTGTGVKSLGWDLNEISGGIEIVYGTNRAYMGYVIDEQMQADYHKGNWSTLQFLARQNAQKVHDRFGDVAQAEVEKRLQ